MEKLVKLNELVAEKIMGWKKVVLSEPIRELTWMWDKKEGCHYKEAQNCPSYSTSIELAFDVVNCLLKDGWTIEIHGSEVLGPDMGGYDVHFKCKSGARGRFFGSANTLPEAICLAALNIPEAYL